MFTYNVSSESIGRIKFLPLVRGLLFAGLLVSTASAFADDKAPQLSEVELGRKIYHEGVLPSGASLTGKRGEHEVQGTTAACETCHRPSGMGSLEGNIVAPPINGRFLFATPENREFAIVDIRQASNIIRAHAPYDEQSFGKAVREGVNIGGKTINALMPHYDLKADELKALMAYLRQLSVESAPGVDEDSLQFATIVAPGVEPNRSQIMVTMLQSAFKQRNVSQTQHSGQMRMPLDLIPRQKRDWELSVWELKGEPDTWGAQLAEFYKNKPVFAVLSGISSTTWAPVQAFCEQEKVPCLLPSVPLAPADPGFYSMYYSRGVALEADVLAKQLRGLGDKAPKRLVQVYRDDEVGRGAVQALSKALEGSNIKLEPRVLHSLDAKELNGALKDVSSKDAAMFWLRPAELTALGKAVKKASATFYVSGYLAEENYAFVPKAWQANVRVVYPYELGEKRAKNTRMMNEWLLTYGIPFVDEGFQGEVFFNAVFLTDMISQMLDNLFRDYMIERAEDMLSWGSNVSAYPHLSSARGQRFASRGAYITHLDKDGKLVADTEWIVP